MSAFLTICWMSSAPSSHCHPPSSGPLPLSSASTSDPLHTLGDALMAPTPWGSPSSVPLSPLAPCLLADPLPHCPSFPLSTRGGRPRSPCTLRPHPLIEPSPPGLYSLGDPRTVLKATRSIAARFGSAQPPGGSTLLVGRSRVPAPSPQGLRDPPRSPPTRDEDCGPAPPMPSP